MPVYLGLPLRCDESFRLFGFDLQTIKNSIMSKHNLSEHQYMDCYFVEHLNNFFKDVKMDMRVFYTDKGQCIVGYEINQDPYKFNDVDEYIHMLSELKTKFVLETKKYIHNFNAVVLEHMEDNEEVVCFPKPYVIQY